MIFHKQLGIRLVDSYIKQGIFSLLVVLFDLCFSSTLSHLDMISYIYIPLSMTERFCVSMP